MEHKNWFTFEEVRVRFNVSAEVLQDMIDLLRLANYPDQCRMMGGVPYYSNKAAGMLHAEFGLMGIVPIDDRWVDAMGFDQLGGLVQLVTEFEGKPFTTLNMQDRPAWVAGEVARALEYDDAKDITRFITREWADDFVEGVDFLKVEGDDLRTLKKVVVSSTTGLPVIDKYASSAIVLFESGLHTVLLRTERPVGKRLRRKLVEEILPQIARTGEYSPKREVVNDRVVDKVPATVPVLDLAVERERRLLLQAETNRDRIELARRQFEYNAVMRQVEARKDLPEGVRNAYATLATERALGQPLTDLRPSLPAAWRAASAIADTLKVSAQMVGKVAKALGMQVNAGLPGISRRVLTTPTNSPKHGPVDQWLYSPEAEELIRDELVKRGKVQEMGKAG